MVIAVWLTWPLATQMPTIVSDTGDPLLNTWIIDWDCYAFTHRGATLFQADIFYPAKYPLAFSENMIGVALVMLPSYLAGAAPLTTYNLALLLGFAFSAYGAYVLARKVTRSVAAAVIAGVLYGFVQYRFDHLAHVQIAWGGWLPLIFAALLHFREKPSAPRALLLFAALVMNGLTNIHWLLFGFFGFAVAVAVVAIARWIPEGEERRFRIGLACATVAAVIVLYPVLRPYRVVSQLYDMKRSTEEVRGYSAVWTDWLVSSDRSTTYGHLPGAKISHNERHLFPGLLALFLTAAALLGYREAPSGAQPSVDRQPPPRYLLHVLDALIAITAMFTYVGMVTERFELVVRAHQILSLTSAANPATYLVILIIVRLIIRMPGGGTLGGRLRASRLPLPLWIAVLLIVFGVLGSFGLNAFFHTFLFQHVSAFRGIRAVARWSMLAYVGFSLASAYGVVALTQRQSRLLTAALIFFALNDVRTNIVWDHAITKTPAVTQWIAQTHFNGPVIELPLDAGSAQYYYMLWSTTHHKLVMNGMSGFEPPVYLRMHDLTDHDPIADELTDILIRNRCPIVILHNDFLGPQTPRYLGWIRRELARGRLAFVRRFDHGAEGDWVFAVTPVMRDWQRLRTSESRDAAGFTPTQNLQRMLAGEATYNNITFGNVDIAGGEPNGRFRIEGWALSPYSVREVIARIECGKRQIPLTRSPRGDVSARWPWYPDPNAGYGMSFDHRPHGVRHQTDIQIEIVDGRGERTRLPTALVDW